MENNKVTKKSMDENHPCYNCSNPGSWRCWEPAVAELSLMAWGCHCGEYPGTGPQFCRNEQKVK